MNIYQVDAFTDTLFAGNPAAVCPLDEWLPEDLMQRLGMENNLAETAFFVKQADGSYHIRWFTPTVEVALCGHATLASAYIIFNHLNYSSNTIQFNCKSGLLEVKKKGDLIELNFPSRMPAATEVDEKLLQGLSIKPSKILKSRDYFFVYDKEEDVINFVPDFNILNQFDCIGIIITAKGNDVDFVSRFFAPSVGVDEDPVTGSAHSQLIPFWGERLDKKEMHAKQLSPRGGELWVSYAGDRVTIAGQCVFYMKGEIEV